MGLTGEQEKPLMIKKIKVERLRPGMFIHDMNCAWLDHPFLRNKIKVANREMIEKIILHGVQEVYIDTKRGLDVKHSQFGKGILRDIEAQLTRVRNNKAASSRRAAKREKAKERRGTPEASNNIPRGAHVSGHGRDGNEQQLIPPNGSAGPPREAVVTTNGATASNNGQAPTEMAKTGRAEVSSRDNNHTLEESQIKPTDNGEAEAPPSKAVPLQEEMPSAMRINKEAKKIVQSIMEDARLGRQIQVEKVYPVVGKIADSILRNKDALLTISTIREADEDTYMHSLGVCVLMICFSNSLRFDREEIIQAGVGALLHDVGKVKLPREILYKSGKLSEEEEKTFKEHIALGEAILSKTPNISPLAMSIVTQHHERYDGTGYPHGLKGEAISPYSQMAAVANMYEILTSDRWYRKGMEPTEALSKLLGWSKYHFSEEMVHKFIRCIGIYPIGTLVRLESGLLGVVVEQGSKDLLHPVVRAIYDTKKEWFTKPWDMDLSNPVSKTVADGIVCHESPEKWKISPQSYLTGRMKEKGLLSRRLTESTIR
jgi:HD-GYP domain-containing protein (c-di-GMP phosphodiesterase class II)